MTHRCFKTWWAILTGLFACVVGAQAYDFEKDGIYYNVTSLDDLTVEVTYEGEEKKTTFYKNDLVIPDYVEFNGKAFEVKGIGEYAFWGASSSSIELPNTINTIGSSAFAYSSIKRIQIPNSVINMGLSVFSNCYELIHITLSNNMESVPKGTFVKCYSLSNITIPENTKVIELDAFTDCTSLTSIKFPKTLEEISRAFQGCKSLKSLTIPANVHVITSTAFKNCESLSEVIWETDKIKEIQNWLFENCKSLTSMVIPENVESINSESFLNCSGLESIQLPMSIKSISESAFSGCEKLISVTVNSPAPPTIEYETFVLKTYLNGTLYVPKGCKALYESAEYWKNFSNIVETDYVPTTFCPLTAKVSGYGSISFEGQTLSNGTATWQAPAHSTATIFIQPDYGYRATATITQADGSETTLEATDVLEVEVGAEALTVEVSFERITVYLTIQQAESGCVKVGGGYGEARTVSITPYEGWRIHSVTLDGMDYTASLDADNRFTTPGLLENAFLNVAFEQDGSRVRGLQADHAKVYAQDGRLVIEQAGAGTVVRVYDEGGQLVRSLTADGGRMTVALPRGHVYLVRTAQKTVKIGL